ncbi:hypothetical protein V3O24_04715 [Methylobacter sp. Wu8]|uniref:hypothetical protein n=1 Tax=Methylobacter sp. Wu8 TaxID=3118457 RepID=UPI002F31C21E
MDEEKVRKIIEPEIFKEDGGLYDLGWYLSWNKGDESATLDGEFTADDLEAIAWWMRNKSV